MSYIYTILYFFFYSFAGWILEVIYRSWSQKRFVNAGFLHGCFVPIYGFGALLVIAGDRFMNGLNPALQLVIIALALTALEYAVGWLFEKAFGLKLWDYHANRFNLHGRVSLQFSALWAAMAGLLVFVIHPRMAGALSSVRDGALVAAAAFLAAYFITDVVVSVISLRAFKDRIAYLRTNYSRITNGELGPLMKSLRRLLSAFPNLNAYLDGNINDNLRERVNAFLEGLQARLRLKIAHGRGVSDEREYGEMVGDILANEEFLRLREFPHHNSSIYQHAVSVSYLAYKVCRQLKLDYRSAARGGLLHDFFLYDWRNHDEPDLPKEKYHGIEHPKIALENSLRHFVLNDIERDIIVKHMWPLTPFPPRYRESYVVTFVDKYLASKEYLMDFAKKRAGKKSSKKARNGAKRGRKT